MPSHPAPIGQITRGTTNTNRLRRVDRWIARSAAFRRAPVPLVVDLGYGASGVTALELWTRLVRVRADAEVVGLEIDPARVARATAQLADVRAGRTPFSPEARVSFRRGGFEVPTASAPAIVRAMNVLRQYDEGEVSDAWRRIAARLQPTGLLVEGTCDELGRIGSWVDIDASATPQRLTLAVKLGVLAAESPSVIAERLPKALIHRNVPGEPIHALLGDLDTAWERASGLASFGLEQRWIATVDAVRAVGWPVEGGRSRWRLGELTVPWRAVAPRHPLT